MRRAPPTDNHTFLISSVQNGGQEFCLLPALGERFVGEVEEFLHLRDTGLGREDLVTQETLVDAEQLLFAGMEDLGPYHLVAFLGGTETRPVDQLVDETRLARSVYLEHLD